MNKFFSVYSLFLFITALVATPFVKLDASLLKEKSSQNDLGQLIKNLASSNVDLVTSSIGDLAKTGDPRLEKFFELYRQGSVYNWPTETGEVRIVVNEETLMDDDFNEFAPLFHPLTSEPILVGGVQAKPDLLELEDISPSRKLRSIVNSSKFLLRLFSDNFETKLSGVKKCGDPSFLPDALPYLREIADNPIEDEKIRYTAEESIELMVLSGVIDDKNSVDSRISALRKLGDLKSLRAYARINAFEKDILKIREAGDISKKEFLQSTEIISSVQKKIEKHKDSVELSGNLFRGVSYGSVLILIALGLAITFGLMGVINMAHGELMMIGAYTTYEVQMLFSHTPENPVDYYYLVALPLAFLVSALVGLIMEALVVRHLYNRPLESLLATWGVGLFLIQVIRIIYGDNIGVNSPTWARGGFEISQDK